MRTLQLATLGLFGLFAVLTAFFQLRAGMKSGEASRTEEAAPVRDAGLRYSRLAGRCAILAAVMLALCILCGVVQRM